MRTILFLLASMVFVVVGCKKQENLPEVEPVVIGVPELEVKTLLSGQGIIWGFDFLPGGKMIFTQKTGTLRIFDTTTNTTEIINGLPANISAASQGGLLDVCVSPDYASTGFIYITYSIQGGFLRLARFVLSGTNAGSWQILKETETASSWSGHYGSRLAFGSDGKLFWSVGEGGGGSLGGASSPYQNGQNLNTTWGKIHRLNADGTVPTDNPLINGVRTSIFSYGHRNPQGIAFQPGTGRLFSTEHGPSGGCELNLIGSGNNYGWPLYSAGVNYNGTNISNGSHAASGITAPLKFWAPALAPSGLSFINHPSFGDWNGNLLAGSLGRRHLLMISMVGGNPGAETILLENTGRVRNVKQGPLGKIYVSVEDGGRLLELKAK
jgi:glucose/arabinose dehydrogenase